MATKKPLVLFRPDGAALFFLTEAVSCATCGAFSLIVVNRAGKTRCAPCDVQDAEARQNEWGGRQ